jgi:hypothetical protein
LAGFGPPNWSAALELIMATNGAEPYKQRDTVVVSSPSVPHPTQARDAWQPNPEATLFNGAGLTAAPFRTDPWPEVTQTARPYERSWRARTPCFHLRTRGTQCHPHFLEQSFRID